MKKKTLVIVGSKNPVKIKAGKIGFAKYFNNLEVKGLKLESEVSAQPLTLKETFKGALNRAKNGLKIKPQADFSLGLEGGMQKHSFGWTTFGVVVILSKNNKKGVSISSQLVLPEKMVEKVLKGKELGVVLSQKTGIKNINQKQGAFGFFTSNRVTRETSYINAIILALAPLIKKELY
ncbi:inosine/xanthosine triphosphatase [Candidatus Beckwithbacteria bacterium CG10_big_fil_rev_8_21_14_0_10_34_10]|uniref:Probable inosine/xanthosine triphosphatase n=1 Tax=Candidatus Beckwithbacteria bacterium CG10_big_fil_rev_8_21_14_0_10_34_10 TaxID=1974495 RepID=A0A2H0W8H6_9BACT|nr:MAG: inosine/xanthosine triphosphatase [Candidatus Beckwithbacteria bacterium CG10_big_fil_rev_8_21_14_0_10_34_10]